MASEVKNLDILYVDDEHFMHEPFRMMMETLAAASVESAFSGEEAMKSLASRSYDAVVSDYQMPGMSGIELLKNIRSGGADVPFILFTGRGREEVVIEAINSGADYYLQKGMDPMSQFTELTHMINRAVVERREREDLRTTNQRLEALVNNMHDAVALFDLELRVFFVNPAFEKILGWSRQEVTGMKVPWVPEEELGVTRNRLMEIARTGKPVHYEGLRRSKDGKALNFHISMAPITDSDGNVDTISAIMSLIEPK